MEIKKKIGKRIQELRQKNGLKQSELAEKVDIATKHQSCIETGKNYPSAELMEKYAKVLNVNVSELLLIEHIKPKEELLKELYEMLNNSSDEEIITIYKIVKSIKN